MALGKSGTHLSAVASTWNDETQKYESQIRAEVVLNSPEAKNHFAQILAQKQAIEAEVGEPLVWHNPDNARMCRIYLRKDADIHDRTAWGHQHQWLKDRIATLHRVFGPRVRTLKVGDDAGDTE